MKKTKSERPESKTSTSTSTQQQHQRTPSKRSSAHSAESRSNKFSSSPNPGSKGSYRRRSTSKSSQGDISSEKARAMKPTPVSSNEPPVLDGFLLVALKNPKDYTFMMQLDKDLEEFINDKTKTRLEFPPMNSYHRLIVHRVAQYFKLAHVVDSSRSVVILFKTKDTEIPVLRLLDLAEQIEDKEQVETGESSKLRPDEESSLRGRGRGRGRGGRGRGGYRMQQQAPMSPQGSSDFFYPIIGSSVYSTTQSPAGSMMLPPIFAVPGFNNNDVAEADSQEPLNQDQQQPQMFPSGADVNAAMLWHQMMYYGAPQMIAPGADHQSNQQQGMFMLPYPMFHQPDPSNPMMLMPIPIPNPVPSETIDNQMLSSTPPQYFHPQFAPPPPFIDPNAMLTAGMQNLSLTPSNNNSPVQQQIQSSPRQPIQQQKPQQRIMMASQIDPPEPSHILEIVGKEEGVEEIPDAKIKKIGESVKLAIFKNSFMAREALEKFPTKLRPWKAKVDTNMTIPPVTKNTKK